MSPGGCRRLGRSVWPEQEPAGTRRALLGEPVDEPLVERRRRSAVEQSGIGARLMELGDPRSDATGERQVLAVLVLGVRHRPR